MTDGNAGVAEAIVGALKSVLPHAAGTIGLHEPEFAGNEWAYTKDCLDTGWVSSVGAYVDRFERDLVAYTGAGHAIATVNGTAALHVALQLVGVGPGDEVLIPALSFVATANAVAYCGAIPHFVDVEASTLGMAPGKLDAHLVAIAERRGGRWFNRETGRRLAAIVPMHAFGHPVDLDPLAALALETGLPLVEDAAESLGSTYRGRHTGLTGTISALSFNGNKIVTTGGGGALLTNNAALARVAKHLTTTAKVPHRWAFEHDAVGYNYRLPNLNAALGCAQLERLPIFVEEKRGLAAAYARAFEDLSGVQFFQEQPFARSNYWLNVLLLDPELAQERDRVLAATNDQGLMTRPAWNLLHRLPMYADAPRMDLSVSEDLVARIINIPSSPRLGRAHG